MGGEGVNGAEIHIPSLQESKSKSRFEFLEKHILKRKIQRNQRICTISYSVCPWGGWVWAGYRFRWGVLVLFGEKTRRGFLRPLQKIGPVNTGLPEQKKREKG